MRGQLQSTSGAVHTYGRNAVAEAIAARDQSSLYVASRFFANPGRFRSFCAYYALMRVVDDRIDAIADRRLMSARDRKAEHEVVAAWEEAVRSSYECRSSSRRVAERCSHPEAPALLAALAEALATYPVPSRLWASFFHAMHRDLDHDRFDTWQDFLEYTEGASVAPTTIFLILLTSRQEPSRNGLSFPVDFDLDTCGRALGTFAYLVHILRDLADDLRAGTAGLLYFSYEDLARHDLTEAGLFSDLTRGEAGAQTRWLVADILRRARSYLAAGRRAMAPLSGRIQRDCAFILELMVTLYECMMERIESAGCDPVAQRHRLSSEERRTITLDVANRTGFELPGDPYA